MLFNGFKFGLIIQLAIGPVCLFILSTAINTNLVNSLSAVAAVTIVDFIYIILAISGAVSFLKDPKLQIVLKITGSMVVLLFGINIILNAFKINIIPGLNLTDNVGINNSFFYALVLTASNPLTILFWSGIFSAKIIEENLRNNDLLYFGLGCLSATIIFLSLVSLAGFIFHRYIPAVIIEVLNLIVGFFLIYFAVKSLFMKRIPKSSNL